MRILRTAMVDFQTEEDLKEYLAKYKGQITTYKHLDQVIIYQTGPTSIQVVAMSDDAEALETGAEDLAKWREKQNFKGVVDTILLQGEVLFDYKRTLYEP